MKQIMVALIFGVFLTVSVQSQAKGIDVKMGKEAFETCRGCHSTPNYSNVSPTYYVPKIGGQRKGYVASSLVAYKNEARARSSMLANTYNLSDNATKAIALHVELSAGNKLKAPFSGDPVKGKKLAGTCQSCHTNDLKDDKTAPILAGQYGNYLAKVMAEYQSGIRKDPVMQSMLADFSKDDLEDIASYFSDMKGLSVVK